MGGQGGEQKTRLFSNFNYARRFSGNWCASAKLTVPSLFFFSQWNFQGFWKASMHIVWCLPRALLEIVKVLQYIIEEICKTCFCVWELKVTSWWFIFSLLHLNWWTKIAFWQAISNQFWMFLCFLQSQCCRATFLSSMT